MTIETSPANNLFAGFNDDEKKMLAVAVRRVEELEETRRITAGLAGQAQAIQSDLKARGVDDGDVLREAAEAVAATASAQGKLASEVDGYRKLFGPDGRAAAAVGQYTQLLRNAHAGDVEALNSVQAARRELYEARDASAQHREGSDAGAGIEAEGRYQVRQTNPATLETTTMLTTASALAAFKEFNGKADREVLDRESGKLVGYVSWEQDGSTPRWKMRESFAAAVETAQSRETTFEFYEAHGSRPLRQFDSLQDAVIAYSREGGGQLRAVGRDASEQVVMARKGEGADYEMTFATQEVKDLYVMTQKISNAGRPGGEVPTSAQLQEATAAAARSLQPEREATANTIEQDGPERSKRVDPALVQPDQEAVASRDGKRPQLDLQHALPESFAGRYVKDGDKWVEAGNAAHVIVVDKGSKLQVPREFDAESVKAAVDLAEARGWSSMKVAGDQKFRQALYLEAASRGIEVKGYTPNEAERKWTAENAAKHQRTNLVMENDVAKAFHDARTPAERREAAERHPELKKAFAIEAAYSQLAKQIHGKSGQDAFMARMRDNIATDLAQGRELVDVRLRRPMFKQQEFDRSQHRDQDRGR